MGTRGSMTGALLLHKFTCATLTARPQRLYGLRATQQRHRCQEESSVLSPMGQDTAGAHNAIAAPQGPLH